MPVYKGSRYTNIPIYNQPDNSDYIKSRVVTLHLGATAGDKLFKVLDASGFYKGKQVTIVDGANTETVICDTPDGVSEHMMYDPTIGSFTTMYHYHIHILNGGALKYSHIAGVTITCPKVNYRQRDISSISIRTGGIPTDSNDSIITWRFNDRLDIYAMNNYGDAQLGWAILDANPLYLSELDISIGDMIIIPTYDKVRAYMRSGS